MPSVRRVLLTVLSAWHGLAAFKNLCDLAAEFELLPDARRFGSKNFAAIERLLAPLRLPRELVGAMLAGAVALETAIAVAFARDRDVGFTLGIVLFGSFALVDEAMVDYALDETHRDVLMMLLVAYLVTREP